uniref:Uncharacterized protein n=1 Tax=Varanus komodoensis TaxID=61221 RepID=A0A8D2L3C3_VARKO
MLKIHLSRNSGVKPHCCMCFLFLLDKYGVPYPAFFFLKKSYWCKSRSTYSEDASGNEQGHGMIFSDKAESVPSEFDGKEVIRLNNIKKTYKVGKMETEALRGKMLLIPFNSLITSLFIIQMAF